MRERERKAGLLRLELGMILKWMEWSHEEKDIDKEWSNDGKMREISELRVSPCFKNLPHFTLIPSFWDILEWWNWSEWSENEWNVSWMKSLLSSFSFLGIREWWGMTEWGGMRVILELSKKTEFWGASHSAIIRSFGHHSGMELFLTISASSQSTHPPLQRGMGG